MKPTVSALYHVEPLAEYHNRASFSCGVPELDKYLRHQAGQDAKRKIAAPFVLLDLQGTVIGYYTLSAHGIRLSELPVDITKKLPKYPVFPATLLGPLAIGREHQRKNLGQFLLLDALQRSLRNTAEIASMYVIVDAYDEQARAFYLHHEFRPIPDHAGKLFISMRTVEKLFAG